MTEKQQNYVWQMLTPEIREELKRDYSKALQANRIDPINERIDSHIVFLEKYFGKHNLATTEEKPRLKVGDQVCIKQCDIVHPKYFGIIDEIVGIDGVYYRLRNTDSRWTADALELYEESPTVKICNESTAASIDSENECDAKVDWLAYRMELAKTLAVKVFALKDDQRPSNIAECVVSIVDGIVERLKGGDK